jgi:uncharacterized protein (DUF302 family)
MRKLFALALVSFSTLLVSAVTVHADELLMARVDRPFPEAMNQLQESIRAQGYTISRVQRVDVGLTASGFKTAEYRVVFYGKPDEMKKLPAQHPELAAYLPLSIVIYAEGDDTLMLSANPLSLRGFFGKPGLQQTFEQWALDIRAILDDMSRHRK